MKRKTGLFLLAMAFLLAARIAIMYSTPIFEPSEARYAAISANMARTGDFLVPRFTYKGVYRPFAGKPPLVFQASGKLCRLFGVNELAVRLAPFLSFVGILAILFFAVRRLADKESAMLATGICATSIALYATAGFCMIDVPLAFCSSGALLLYSIYRDDNGPRRKMPLILAIGALLGLGMLTKGPVALAIFGLPVLAYSAVNREWRRVFTPKWIPAILLVFAISVPWFWKMEIAQPGSLKYFFVNENLMRFLVHDYGDMYGSGRETFRGMAAIWAIVATLPWSLFIAFRPRLASLGAMRRSFPLMACIAIAAFWCLTSRVPVAYLLPVVPLFSAHLAIELAKEEKLNALAWRILPFAAIAAPAILAISLFVASIVKPDRLPGDSARPSERKSRFSYEFYYGPWGKGAPERSVN